MSDDDAEHETTQALMERLYGDVRAIADRIMAGERAHHTLQPTALAHEAFLRLADAREAGAHGRLHFLQAAAVTMRRILVDHARARKTDKRGGAWSRVTLAGIDDAGGRDDVDVLALHERLQELATLDERQARIVELRFFGGMTGQEIADALDLSRQTVTRELSMARAWLRHRLADD